MAVFERKLAEVLVFRDKYARLGGGAFYDSLIGRRRHRRFDRENIVAGLFQRGDDSRRNVLIG